MPRLSIEHDPVGADANPRTRRRSIALRLDGKAWLRVEPEVFAELGLSDGDELGDARCEEVELVLARARARLFVVRSLAVRMQSRAEIVKKLEARDVPASVAQEALDRVTRYGYLDDAALAGQLARGMRARGYGRRRAEQKLRARGLVGAVAQNALGAAFAEDDEIELARAALGRRSVGDDGDRRRAVAFLVRRGFSSGAAWAAIRRARDGE